MASSQNSTPRKGLSSRIPRIADQANPRPSVQQQRPAAQPAKQSANQPVPAQRRQAVAPASPVAQQRPVQAAPAARPQQTSQPAMNPVKPDQAPASRGNVQARPSQNASQAPAPQGRKAAKAAKAAAKQQEKLTKKSKKSKSAESADLVIKKLSRDDLLTILAEQSRRIDYLEAENARLAEANEELTVQVKQANAMQNALTRLEQASAGFEQAALRYTQAARYSNSGTYTGGSN